MRSRRRTIRALVAAVVSAVALLALPQPAHADALSQPTTFVFAHSAKCLDLLGFRGDNGAPVGQWTCNGADNQVWLLRSPGGGDLYELRALHSNKCLDALGFRTDNGSPVGQWTCNGLTNQQWRLVVSASGPGLASAVLINRYSGKCLDVPDSSGANGAPVVQWNCDGTTTQRLYPHFQAR